MSVCSSSVASSRVSPQVARKSSVCSSSVVSARASPQMERKSSVCSSSVASSIASPRHPTAPRGVSVLNPALHTSYPPVEEEEEEEETVAVLEQSRLDCNSEGKYGDAEIARLRIQSLCMAEQENRREQMRTKQLAERTAMEEAHKTELADFNHTWDVLKIQEFDAHAQQLQVLLAERNHAEHTAFVDKLQVETEPRTPRWSVDLLRLRKVQQTLGKQKKYPEAGEVKEEADAIESKEHLVWQGTRDKKIAVLEEQYLQRQRMEMRGLIKRIESGRQEQTQAKKTELNRILQRYVNVKMQLESQQKTIMIRLDKYPVSTKDLLAKTTKSVEDARGVSMQAIGA